MKKVLILAYYWPPAGGVASMRWMRLANQLATQGFEISVLSPSNGSFLFLDEQLSKLVHYSIRQAQTYSFEPLQWYNLLNKNNTSVGLAEFGGRNKSIKERIANWIRANVFIPDARVGWVPFAFWKSRKLHKVFNFDLVITTGPPQSAHIIGYLIKKYLRIKWVADFRDPWTDIFYYDQLPHLSWIKKLDYQIETKVLQKADLVTCIGKNLAKLFEGRANNLEVIYNGFDEFEFEDKDTIVLDKGDFNIGYTGSFLEQYANIPLWRVLQQQLLFNTDYAKVKFHLIGKVSEAVKSKIVEYKLQPYFIDHGVKSHSFVASSLKEFDALLFIIPNTKGSNLIITGKLFEYLQVSKPLIGIGNPDGEASLILKQVQGQVLIDYSDEVGLTTLLNQVFSKIEIKTNKDMLNFYSSKNQGSILAKFLKDL